MTCDHSSGQSDFSLLIIADPRDDRMWPQPLHMLFRVVRLGYVTAGTHRTLLLSWQPGFGGGHSLTGEVGLCSEYCHDLCRSDLVRPGAGRNGRPTSRLVTSSPP